MDTNSYFGYWEWNPFPHYVDSWTSDESGTVMTGDVLEPGNYQLEETNAPKPYLVNTTPVKSVSYTHIDVYKRPQQSLLSVVMVPIVVL